MRSVASTFSCDTAPQYLVEVVRRGSVFASDRESPRGAASPRGELPDC
jgi:hypothetical protein